MPVRTVALPPANSRSARDRPVMTGIDEAGGEIRAPKEDGRSSNAVDAVSGPRTATTVTVPWPCRQSPVVKLRSYMPSCPTAATRLARAAPSGPDTERRTGVSGMGREAVPRTDTVSPRA